MSGMAVETIIRNAQAESPGAGQGSRFTVKFPRSPVTAQPANGRVDAPDLTGTRVLIVEDDDVETVQPAERITVVAGLATRHD